MFYHYDDLSFNILAIDTFQHKSGFFHVKGRNFAAMGFRLSGSGIFRIHDQQYVSNAGDVLFIPAGVAYDVEYSGGESLVVHFNNCNYAETNFISLQNQEFIKSKFLTLLKHWKTEQNINRTKSEIYDILYAIDEDKRQTFDADFLRGVQFINENYTDPLLKISDACEAAHLSESSLHRRFLKYYNQSSKDYLQNLRLRRAMELLFSGKFSIKEIAFSSGFSDEKYFSRFIKKKTGKSPSSFLQQRLI